MNRVQIFLEDMWFEITYYFWLPFKTIYNFIDYRFIDKYHIVKLKLKPDYYEVEQRMEEAIYQLLIDYVELECSHMGRMWLSNTEDETFRQKLYWKLPRGIRRNIRSEKYGLFYLDKQIAFYKEELEEHNTQCENENFEKNLNILKEIIHCYLWAKKLRYERVDPWRVEKVKDGKLLELARPVSESFEIEDRQFDEDTEMLKKIIELRNYLWT